MTLRYGLSRVTVEGNIQTILANTLLAHVQTYAFDTFSVFIALTDTLQVVPDRWHEVEIGYEETKKMPKIMGQ